MDFIYILFAISLGIIILGLIAIMVLYYVGLPPFKNRKLEKVKLSKEDRKIHRKYVWKNAAYFTLLVYFVAFMFWFFEFSILNKYNLEQYEQISGFIFLLIILSINLTFYYYILKATLLVVDKTANKFSATSVSSWFFISSAILLLVSEITIAFLLAAFGMPIQDYEPSNPWGLFPAFISFYLAVTYKRKKK